MKAVAVDTNNLPTPKDEAWKYTNLPRAVPDGLSREESSREIVIHKTRGQNGGDVEDIVFTGAGKTLHMPVMKVVLEEGAEATIIERHDGQGAYWKNIAVEVELGANAHLHHYRLFGDADEAVTTINTRIRQERDSSYHAFALNHSGGLIRNQASVMLSGSGAHCDLSGVNLLKGDQHGDTTILIEHQAPHCTSSQFFRSVLDDNARGVFQGKVHVHQIAQKTDGYQLSNALLLSETAEMDVKPELEIYADDVKCSHGSTIGQLDEEPLFYLRSRGLSEAEARLLLIQSFVNEVSEKIRGDDLRAHVQEICETWLQNTL